MSFFEGLSNNLILSLQIHNLYLEIHKMIHEKYACNDPGNIYLFLLPLNMRKMRGEKRSVCEHYSVRKF